MRLSARSLTARILSTITGFVGVMRLTESMKRRPFRISSTYRMIAFVAGSVTGPLMKSSKVRSSLVSHRDHRRKPDLFGKAPVHNRGDDRPALRDERDGAGPGETGSNVVLIPCLREHKPEAVGAHDPDPVLPCGGKHLVFERLSRPARSRGNQKRR